MGSPRKRPRPKVLIGPDGTRHVLAVFLINTKERGVPRLCTMSVDEKHVYDLAGGEEFFTAYVPEERTLPEKPSHDPSEN